MIKEEIKPNKRFKESPVGGTGGFLFTPEEVQAILDYERRSKNRITREISRLSKEQNKTLDYPDFGNED